MSFPTGVLVWVSVSENFPTYFFQTIIFAKITGFRTYNTLLVLVTDKVFCIVCRLETFPDFSVMNGLQECITLDETHFQV